jgi:hypothetical protein
MPIHLKRLFLLRLLWLRRLSRNPYKLLLMLLDYSLLVATSPYSLSVSGAVVGRGGASPVITPRAAR